MQTNSYIMEKNVKLTWIWEHETSTVDLSRAVMDEIHQPPKRVGSLWIMLMGKGWMSRVIHSGLSSETKVLHGSGFTFHGFLVLMTIPSKEGQIILLDNISVLANQWTVISN